MLAVELLSKVASLNLLYLFLLNSDLLFITHFKRLMPIFTSTSFIFKT